MFKRKENTNKNFNKKARKVSKVQRKASTKSRKTSRAARSKSVKIFENKKFPKILQRPKTLLSSRSKILKHGITNTNGLQTTPEYLDREYVEACQHPGKKKTIPPFNDSTMVSSVIPLVLNAGMYESYARTPVVSLTTGAVGVSSVPFGTVFPAAEYTVVILCPAATAFGLGFGVGSSGIYTRQTFNDGSFASINYESMSTLFPGMATPAFYTPISMTSAWGSDMSDIGIHGNCFALEARIQILAPHANLCGVYWTGHVPLGSLVDDNGSELKLTVAEMIKLGTSHQMTSEIIMNEFIRNPNTLVEVHRNAAATVDMGSILGECLTYVIIPKPVLPIAVSGTSAAQTQLPFSLAITLASNWIVWPKRTPASVGLTEDAVRSKRVHRDAHSMELRGKTLMMSNKVIKKKPSLGESEKGMMESAWDWLSDIDWKKWGTIALELAATLAEPEVGPCVVDLIDINVNVFGDIPQGYSSIDPEAQKLLDNLYGCVSSWNDYYSVHRGQYQYPKTVWNQPARYVVPRSKRETWNNLSKDGLHPAIRLDLSVDFILEDASPEATSWFDQFILLYQPDASWVAVD